MDTNLPYGHKIYQNALKYSKRPKLHEHFPFHGPSKHTQIGIFGMKIYHLATLILSTCTWGGRGRPSSAVPALETLSCSTCLLAMQTMRGFKNWLHYLAFVSFWSLQFPHGGGMRACYIMLLWLASKGLYSYLDHAFVLPRLDWLVEGEITTSSSFSCLARQQGEQIGRILCSL
jgi:hypothetical protein